MTLYLTLVAPVAAGVLIMVSQAPVQAPPLQILHKVMLAVSVRKVFLPEMLWAVLAVAVAVLEVPVLMLD
jgi:hypothetical protein